MDAEESKTIGLIEQTIWGRETEERGKSRKRKQRGYTEKESYKWEQASRQMKERLGEEMRKVISVCHRESDLYEYIHYKVTQGQRLVVSARHNRVLVDEDGGKLFEHVENSKVIGKYKSTIREGWFRLQDRVEDFKAAKCA